MTSKFGEELVRRMAEQYNKEQAQNADEAYGEGYMEGYDKGCDDGYKAGYEDCEEANEYGYDDGYENGYKDGYNAREYDNYDDCDCDKSSCNCSHCKSKQSAPIMANISTPYGMFVVGASDWQDFKNAIDAIENTIG